MRFYDTRGASLPPTRFRTRGFTLVELVISMAMLLVGIVAVAQLVPLATRSNMRNRQDSTATVLAERLLTQMMNQSITATQFTDMDGRVIMLGSVVNPGLVGNPIVLARPSPGAQLTLVRIDFTAGAVPNYNYTFVNPNDAIPIPYEVRWAVITNMQGTTVISKRFLVGVWRRDPRGVTIPVTVDGWVQR